MLKVIGIGASAGGLEAIQHLFDHVPSNTGHAFVIIQHLSPNYKSLMPELLAKHTDMDIFTAENKQELKPNCIFLNKSQRNLKVKGNRLYLIEKGSRSNLNLPIDIFFHSLGEEHQENAIGVILSGTGSDGSRGIKTIKEKGGLVFIQKPETAHFDGMPNSSIGTGMADYILPPQSIGELISNHTHDQLIEDNSAEGLFLNVLIELQKHKGVDFGKYKRNTLSRRLEKRINMSKTQSLKSYLEIIKHDENERENLHNDFLIGVTNFFRDPPAYDILEKDVFPELCGKSSKEQTIRIWVPGCSTGEEAYSIAIALDSYIEKNKLDLDFKIFASDIHESNLIKAGLGVYNTNAVDELKKAHLENYFVKTGDQIRIAKKIRDKVIFAYNNLLKDPPFIRVDFISCRNLLIYLDSKSQQKIINNFSFSLNENGFLFLGNSESLGNSMKLFTTIDSKWKVFRFKGEFSKSRQKTIGLDAESYTSNFEPIKAMHPRLQDTSELPFYKFLGSHYSPSLVLVDKNFEIHFIKGDINKRLNIQEGIFQKNIVQMVNQNLASIIRNGIGRSAKNNSPVVVKDIVIEKNDPVKFDLKIFKSEIKNAEDLFVIEFGEDKEANEIPLEIDSAHFDSLASERIEELEYELRIKSDDLRNLVEELETSNEELQSSNEELMASNEELQSTNEELQSVNEELFTVNSELQEKNEELLSIYNNLNNLYSSQEIATLFLDKNLSIKFFTPHISAILGLKETDINRSLENFMFFDENTRKKIIKESKKSIKNGSRFEIKVQDNGRNHLIKIYPFLNGQTIEGVNITLVDVTPLHEKEIQLIEARNQAIEASKQKDIFLSNFSHEIRTPITSIIGFVNLLKNNGLTKKSKEEYINHIQSSYDQLMTIINDILDLSKLEKGFININKESLLLVDLLDRLIKKHQKQLAYESHNIRLELKHPEENLKNLKIITDPVRLTQVLNNLLTNAIKFTPDGKIEVGYEMATTKKIKIWVKDEGIGIKKEKQELIFERFAQVEEKLSMQMGGIGLGLSIAKKIMSSLNGTIGLKSTYGKGTTFTITLPISSGIAKSSSAIPKSRKPYNVNKLLIADDSPSIQFYYKSLLSKKRITLLQAYNGQEAVDICKKNQDIDLVLMDLRMPIKDGITAFNEIRTFNDAVPIIAQSAFAMNDQVKKFNSIGFNQYLTKPVSEEVLLNLMN